jgi:hypothetical protein
MRERYSSRLEISCMCKVSGGVFWTNNIQHFIHIVQNPIALCSPIVIVIPLNKMFDLGEGFFDRVEIW